MTSLAKSCPMSPDLKGSPLSCTSLEETFDAQVGLPCLVPYI